MESKAEIRLRVRREKQRHTPAELAERSAAVLAQVEALPEFRRAAAVAAYWSLPDEVGTHEFIEKWCAEKRIFLPVMCGEELELREYTPGCQLNKADFGVCEPAGKTFPPERIDLIIVPGMAFDRQGRRLGRGKGFYDRLLARTPALKVGVCFDFQRVDRIPVEAHDVPMGIVISD